MNFATRDRYRHVVEKIAKQSRLCEGEVAETAIRLAHEGAPVEAAMIERRMWVST